MSATNLFSTFGNLDRVADQVVVPSTLTYKERVSLRAGSAVEYGRLYTSAPARTSNVWDRLTLDASVRNSIPSRQTVFVEGTGISYDGPSGFVTNNVQKNVTAPPKGAEMLDPPVETLHPITMRSYKKNYPMDFMSVIRPDTHTTNQTLRMLGTYSGDDIFAQKMSTFIPSGTHTGTFHPDVKLTAKRQG